MGSGQLIILSAPSGAGKTTLARRCIAELGALGVAAGFSVSYTTRAARPGEEEGRDYHFVSPDQFQQMVDAGQMLEHAQVFDRRYGTGRQATDAALTAGEVLFLDIDWQGAQQVRQTSAACRSVFILPPSQAALRQRLVERQQDDVASVERRMRAARDEMSHYAEYDYLIVNDDLDHASAALLAICLAPRYARAAQVEQNQDLLSALLESPA